MRQSSIFSNSKHICRVKFCQVHHVLKIRQKTVQLWHLCSFPENSKRLGMPFATCFFQGFPPGLETGGDPVGALAEAGYQRTPPAGSLPLVQIRGSSEVPDVVTSYHWLVTIDKWVASYHWLVTISYISYNYHWLVSYKWDPPKKGTYK